MNFFSPPRNPTDSILERNDAEFVAKIRDAVINELEVFKQSVDAYHLWQDQQKQEGAFRRGMSRIRQSFRRQRAPSALAASSTEKKEQTVKLEGILTSNQYTVKPLNNGHIGTDQLVIIERLSSFRGKNVCTI